MSAASSCRPERGGIRLLRWALAGGIVGASLGGFLGCLAYGVTSSTASSILPLLIVSGGLPGALAAAVLSKRAASRSGWLTRGWESVLLGVLAGLLSGQLVALPFQGIVPGFVAGFFADCVTVPSAIVGMVITPVVARRWSVVVCSALPLGLLAGFLISVNPVKSRLRQEYERALQTGDARKVTSALDEGVLLRNRPRPYEDDFMPDLSLAVEGGHPEVVRSLLDHGADPNAGSSWGSPLVFAVRGNNEAIARLLITRGAATSEPGAVYSPIDTAVYERQPRLLRLLLEHTPPDPERSDLAPLLDWAESQHDREIVQLLRAHLAVTPQPGSGTSPPAGPSRATGSRRAAPARGR